MSERKLVTFRTIDGLTPIEGADVIEIASIDGWKVIVKKGEFKVGDNCLYFEIDSFLPDGNPAWQFLVDKTSRIQDGIKGHQLRTIKLRGNISQGLALPVKAMFDIVEKDGSKFLKPKHSDITFILDEFTKYIDFSLIFGVVKWDPPLPAELSGQAEGLFPSWIRKTDQERCQNIRNKIFQYEDTHILINPALWSEDVIKAHIENGKIKEINGNYFVIHGALAEKDALYERSMKLDGSSMTAYIRKKLDDSYKVGVCSRNLELKINDENAENAFVKMLIDSELYSALIKFFETTGRSIAVQGELMGPGIQKNREQLHKNEFFVFDIFDIDNSVYVAPRERMEIFKELTKTANIKHVPILDPAINLEEQNIKSIDDLLALAEGPSLKHAFREGDVYKRLDGLFSFKAISNKFLEKQKD